MFELLFQYPRSIFSKGELVLLGAWPKWLLIVLIVAGAAVLGLLIRSRMKEALESVRGWRAAIIWMLQSSLLAAVLLLLWQPAILVSTLKPQQNVVAVVIDDSQSMSLSEDGGTRLEKARKALASGPLAELEKKFQVRTYRMSDHVERVKTLDQLTGQATSSRIGESLKQVAAETAGLPLGGVVLLSDGADNSGGIDLDTISELRSRRVPIHAVGFGRERAGRDIELADAQTPAHALVDSKVAAQVSFSQLGYSGRKARLSVKEGSKVLATREVALKPDGDLQTETVMFQAGNAGARAFEFRVDPLEGEENTKNNSTSRLITVDANKPRILYLEGEPRWEYKFIRRALEDDKAVKLVTMLRTTQNKIYRQGERAPETEQGFPAKVEELFAFQGLIIGSVEVGYFTTTQQELLKQFVDRRGGGILMLGGRAGLGDGGYGRTSLADMLPVVLPDRKNTFKRDPATPELSAAGVDSLITRLAEDGNRSLERWKKMPYLQDYQEIGTPKPGATTLLEMSAGGQARLPLLVIQNYGRGRVGVLGTGGTWRWQMSQPLEDTTHEQFWQQLLRWLVSETPGRVVASTPRPMLFDESKVRLTADVRDRTYLPASDVRVMARILGPEASGGEVEMTPDPTTPGIYVADFNADKAGTFVADIVARRGEEEVGRDVLTFQRQDGVAENFRTGQNRELLEKLASQTGGRYWKPGDLAKLPDAVGLSEAGITVRETRDLWNMPVIFLMLLALRASEWLLRRKWGVV